MSRRLPWPIATSKGLLVPRRPPPRLPSRPRHQPSKPSGVPQWWRWKRSGPGYYGIAPKVGFPNRNHGPRISRQPITGWGMQRRCPRPIRPLRDTITRAGHRPEKLKKSAVSQLPWISCTLNPSRGGATVSLPRRGLLVASRTTISRDEALLACRLVFEQAPPSLPGLGLPFRWKGVSRASRRSRDVQRGAGAEATAPAGSRTRP